MRRISSCSAERTYCETMPAPCWLSNTVLVCSENILPSMSLPTNRIAISLGIRLLRRMPSGGILTPLCKSPKDRKDGTRTSRCKSLIFAAACFFVLNNCGCRTAWMRDGEQKEIEKLVINKWGRLMQRKRADHAPLSELWL